MGATVQTPKSDIRNKECKKRRDYPNRKHRDQENRFLVSPFAEHQGE